MGRQPRPLGTILGEEFDERLKLGKRRVMGCMNSAWGPKFVGLLGEVETHLLGNLWE